LSYFFATGFIRMYENSQKPPLAVIPTDESRPKPL
jgi:hypothetical protein